MDEIKLKTCPFCGREASVIKTICQDNGAVCYHIYHQWACCPIGGITTRNALTEQEAVEDWNRRADNG